MAFATLTAAMKLSAAMESVDIPAAELSEVLSIPEPAATTLLMDTAAVPKAQKAVGSLEEAFEAIKVGSDNPDQYGTYISFKMKPGSEALAPWLANPSNGDFIQQSLRNTPYNNNWKSDVVKQMNKTQLPKYGRLSKYIDPSSIKVRTNYSGVPGTYLPMSGMEYGEVRISVLDQDGDGNRANISGAVIAITQSGKVLQNYTDDCGPIVGGKRKLNTALRRQNEAFCAGLKY